jgi:hypothetical protein
MARIVVLHQRYGCDTGCCGHVVVVDGEQVGDFDFSHPEGSSTEDLQEYARKLVTQNYGEEHVTDIDWTSSMIIYD